MVPCQQCGADNMLGAIFCRNCGTRLNLDNIRPKTINQTKRPVFANAAGLVWRLLVVVLLAGACGVLVALFLTPPHGFQPAAADEKAQDVARRQVDAIRKGRGPFAFDAGQLTTLANAGFGLDKPGAAGGGSLRPERVAVDLLASGYLRLTLKSTLAGQLPVYTVVVGKPVADGRGLTFQVVAVRMGRVTLPESMRGVALQRFMPLLAGCKDLQELLPRLAACEVRDNRLWVTPAAAAAPAAR